MKPSIPAFLSPGRILSDSCPALQLRLTDLERHIFIGGGTGNGKSKLLELLCRQLLSLGAGFTYIDIHGDGVEALTEYLACHPVDVERLHILRPGIDRSFSFDPFADIEPTGSPLADEARLLATVDRIFAAFVRNLAAADRELMKRLKRWFRNIAYMCGFKIDGRHVGLHKALVLTDPKNAEFQEIIERNRPFMNTDIGKEILGDFEKLQMTKSPRQQEQWIESSINLLTGIMGPAVRLMFGQHAPSHSLENVIRTRGVQLVNLRKSHELSREESVVIGGLVCNFLIHAAETLAEKLPAHERVPHFLIIDEAENFLGDDLRMGFAELRKVRLSLCVAIQDLSCLRKGDLDLVNKVLSQCGLQLTFQQQNPEDIEFLAKAFGYGSLDLTPLLSETSLPDGYDWAPTRGLTINRQAGTSTSLATNVSHSRSHNSEKSISQSIQDQVSFALSQNETHGVSSSLANTFSRERSVGDSFSTTEGEASRTSHSRNDSTNQSHDDRIGVSHSRSDATVERERHEKQRTNTHAVSEVNGSGRHTSRGSSLSTGRSDERSRSSTRALNRSLTDGFSESVSNEHNRSLTDGKTLSLSNGKSRSHGRSEGETDATSRGVTHGSETSDEQGISLSFQLTPLARHRLQTQPTGRLVTSVADQLAALMNKMAALPDRVVLVKCKGMGTPFLLRVHDVEDPYRDCGRMRSPQWRADDVQQLIKQLVEAHRYHFAPDKSTEIAARERNRSDRYEDPTSEHSGQTSDKPKNPFES